MTCLQTRLAQRLIALAAIAGLASGAAACTPAQASDIREVDLNQQGQLVEPLKSLAAVCGLGCPGDEDDEGVEIKGIVEGNAAISGVASVDAFFASVIRFKAVSKRVSNDIDANLDAIKGDFRIAANTELRAGLMAQFQTYVDGAVKFEAEPARCTADINASLQAKARCEGEVTPPKVMVECKGGCEVEASVEAKCSADANVECTFVPPGLDCNGSCKGTCEASVGAKLDCSGTCRGTCEGNCSAYSDAAGTQCAGKCEGRCRGSCEFEMAAGAMCEGSCRGECTVMNPSGGCKGAIRAECKAKAGGSIMCDGKCTGEIEPPSAKVECEASVKAEASMNVQCTPPRVTLAYKLKAGGDVQAKARFEAALQTLINVRLPALKASLAQGDSVLKAGAGVAGAATGALEGAFEASGDASLRVKVGLFCAAQELDEVGEVINEGKASLDTSVSAATSLVAMLEGKTS
jgi:hypothetical protein